MRATFSGARIPAGRLASKPIVVIAKALLKRLSRVLAMGFALLVFTSELHSLSLQSHAGQIVAGIRRHGEAAHYALAQQERSPQTALGLVAGILLIVLLLWRIRQARLKAEIATAVASAAADFAIPVRARREDPPSDERAA